MHIQRHANPSRGAALAADLITATPELAKNDDNCNHSANIHPKNVFYAGNSMAGRREAFGTSPESQNGVNTCKNYKMRVLAC